MFILTDPKWKQGAKLEEYEGTWSIVSARESDDGGIFNQWCKPRTGRDSYASKDTPMGVKLGDIGQAIDVLRKFLAHLENEGAPVGSGPEDDIEDTLPF